MDVNFRDKIYDLSLIENSLDEQGLLGSEYKYFKSDLMNLDEYSDDESFDVFMDFITFLVGELRGNEDRMDALIESAREDAYSDGLSEGSEISFDNGYEVGYEAGYNSGYEDGRSESE